MAGQRPIPTSELQDEVIRFPVAQMVAGASTPFGVGAVPLGVAERAMWFERGSLRYSTAQGGAATVGVYAGPAGEAFTLANVANLRLLSSSTFDLNTTTDTAQNVDGSPTGNYVAAGEVVGLIGTASDTVAGVVGGLRFTTRRH